jgi:hypothetical protein
MSVVTTLAVIQQYLTVALGILLVVGVIGNTLNCLVFLQKRLRSNPCSVFFAAASVANITVMVYYIIPTIYSAYNTPTENYNFIYCKLRLYIRNALLNTSRSYLTLACVACYAQSSRNVRVRQLFRPKITLRVTLLAPVVWFIIPLHIPFLTSIQNGKCAMWSGAAALYHSIYICFVAAILPTSLMIIFSLLAYKNLRQMARNVRPLNIPGQNQGEGHGKNAEKRRLQQRDRQLSRMLFVQIVVYLLFTISYPINTLYNAAVLIIRVSKSTDRIAIENFFFFITSGFLTSFFSAASFFVFLTSNAFRKELRQIIGFILRQPHAIGNRQQTTHTTAFT